jgi:lipopolysaccharide export system protein LptC
MTARLGRSVRALERQTGQRVSPVWQSTPQITAKGLLRRGNDRYSRRVALLKRVLPAFGLTLLALVASWPRLSPLLESVRLGFPVIDLREARELRMVNPRYAGVDRYNRPYVVTSAIGRQAPDRDDLMSLEHPKAEMTMHNGALVIVTAVIAMYQSQAQLLDLFGDVNLVHQDGTRFVTKTAHLDVAADTAEGHDPVTGHGPSGDVAAQGFRILDKGDTIVFTGKSDLLLKGSRPTAKPTKSPPTLPAEVEETAARIEAAANMPGDIAFEPAAAIPDETATSAAAGKSTGVRRQDGKSPVGRSTVGQGARDDAP